MEKSEFYFFIKILEVSVEKHGKDKVLTVGHLLNIAKLAKSTHEKHTDYIEKQKEDDWNKSMNRHKG